MKRLPECKRNGIIWCYRQPTRCHRQCKWFYCQLLHVAWYIQPNSTKLLRSCRGCRSSSPLTHPVAAGRCTTTTTKLSKLRNLLTPSLQCPLFVFESSIALSTDMPFLLGICEDQVDTSCNCSEDHWTKVCITVANSWISSPQRSIFIRLFYNCATCEVETLERLATFW